MAGKALMQIMKNLIGVNSMKTIKYFRRTPTELKAFREAVTYFKEAGYEQHEAEEKAWDIFHSARRGRKVTAWAYLST